MLRTIVASAVLITFLAIAGYTVTQEEANRTQHGGRGGCCLSRTAARIEDRCTNYDEGLRIGVCVDLRIGLRIEEQCRPVVFEQHGGRSKEVETLIHAVAAAVSRREGVETAAVRREMLQRITLVIARAAASRIARRTP